MGGPQTLFKSFYAPQGWEVGESGVPPEDMGEEESGEEGGPGPP